MDDEHRPANHYKETDAWENEDLPWISVLKDTEDGLHFALSRYVWRASDDVSIRDEIRSVAAELDTVSKRGAFQWAPTVLKCTFDAQIRIRSANFGEIAGLPPRQFCPKVYKNIKYIFSRLLPLLARLPLCCRATSGRVR